MYCYLSVTSVTELIFKHLNCNSTVTSVTDVTDGALKANQFSSVANSAIEHKKNKPTFIDSSNQQNLSLLTFLIDIVDNYL